MVAVVVGVADVVGRACAVALAPHHEVVVVDAVEDAATSAAAAVEAAGGRARAFAADLTDLSAMEGVAEAVGGDVAVLVNCHFALEWATFADSSMASWDAVVRTNVLGPVVATKAFLPSLRRADAAAVVNLGSVDGFQGNPMVPSYSASKGAVAPLTHVLAHELGQFGIRVNCVARAAVEDPSVVAAAPALHEAAMACTPLARPARAEEVAAVVVYLAGSGASYVTGSTVVVDGGRSGLTPGTAVRTSS